MTVVSRPVPGPTPAPDDHPDPTSAAAPPASAPPVGIVFAPDANTAALHTATTATVARRLPRALVQAARLSWRADRRAVVVLIVCQVGAAVLAATGLAATTRVLGLLLADTDPVRDRFTAAAPTLALLTAALAAGALLAAGAQLAAARVAPKASREADLRVQSVATAVELIAYEHPGFEDGLDAAGVGAERVRQLIVDAQQLTAVLAQLAAVATVLTVLHPVLLPLLLLAAAPRGLAAVRAARIEHRTEHRTRCDTRARTILRTMNTERPAGAEVRAGAMAPFLLDQYRRISLRVEREGLHATYRAIATRLAGDAAGASATGATWAALIALAVTGRVDYAVAGTAVIAVRTAGTALAALARVAATLFGTSLYLDDWHRFLTDAADHRSRRGTTRIPDTGPDRITTHHLEFIYPGCTTPALTGIDLELRRGELVALIGENGSGKSTLAKLLTGLYLPTSGTVAWDGVDLADAAPDSVWRHLALVPQDYTRWPTDARNNIALGRPTTDEPVHAAARAAGADTVIAKLPHGLDTSLARAFWGGHDLSGGEWQRLALARGFFAADNSVLVLDEPTSALDARAERALFDRLRDLAHGRTTIFVTHRLANARAADRIIVLDKGTLRETGTFTDLVAREGGLFAELYQLQEGM
ncbi:ATP-binding cassette domain-containing protein [Embleya sp. NPDC020630]|uniref:ATP-binding cassette domain-containing protein n=1 Tax=Embleya sp. NPDC020630 TaxID=3363979 RepID=UPI0037A80A94